MNALMESEYFKLIEILKGDDGFGHEAIVGASGPVESRPGNKR